MLMRLLSSPSPINVAVWTELYWRWQYLYSFVKDTVEEISAAPEMRDSIYNVVKVGALQQTLRSNPAAYLFVLHSTSGRPTRTSPCFCRPWVGHASWTA
jgi:hypothetical protein